MKIIAFEGPDQVGKTTQSMMMTEHLIRLNKKVRRVKVPVNDVVFYRFIYWMLHSGWAKRFPYFFQFVQFVNKLMFQLFALPFLSLRYDIIVLDRWAVSSVVYGKAEGLHEMFCNVLYKMLRKPDVTIVFDGVVRKTKGVAEDSYEKDKKLQSEVVKQYSNWADGESLAVKINNKGTKEEVHGRILAGLGPLGLKIL